MNSARLPRRALKLPQRFGLLTQLLTGFIAGGLFAAILITVGDNMLRSTSQWMVAMLEDHVRPLARLHHLQARMTGLRNEELELSKLHDIFAVQGHVTRMQREIHAIDLKLQEFSMHLSAHAPGDAGRLQSHWLEYRARLDEEMLLAKDVDMAAVEKISSSVSHLPYTAIEALLAELADNTETAAAQAYQETVDEQARQRRKFLLLVILGSSVVAAGLAWSGRVVVRRIRVLHGHAQKLALGEDSGKIAIGDYDEIGDLAAAFTRMREQVMSREAALRAAQQELEDRVEARTRDLRLANGQLVLFSQVVEQNPVGILIAAIDGRIEYVNAAYLQITGQSMASVIGKQLASAVQGGDGIDLDEAIASAIAGDRKWEVERQGRRVDDGIYWERLRLAAVQDRNGAVTHLLLSREDITERHAQQEKIAYQAHYDALTGLPNRVLCHDRLVRTMEHCQRDGCKAAAMYIDLDNFKHINDTLGHATGDGLLRQAAARLKGVVRQEDTVARLGGDEFLVIVSGLARSDDASAIAEKITEAFTAPFRVDERELVTSPSIGIAVYPDDATDPATLLCNADLAMYEAKDGGRNTFRFFNGAMNADALERLNLLGQLRKAGERDEFVLYFQPQVDLKTGCVVGAEALIRWRHPELGLVPPGRFIPIAEESGLIVAIGTWVLQEACRQAVAWQRAGLPRMVMAVNLSALQFRHPDFHQVVVSALRDSGLDPACLELELTESILIRDTEPVLDKAKQLKALGLALSIDDFGTGYSSLSYLKRFPVDKLKIDQSFVRDMATDSEDATLVRAIIHMAKSLGLKTIAEGVETDAVVAELCATHCDEAQGYFFGRPMPAEEFAAYLRDRMHDPMPTPHAAHARLSRIA